MLNLQSIYFGQRNPDFDYKDFDIIKKVSRLARKHQRQCINSCNGYGYVKNQVYYGGIIDDYAKRTYGFNVKSAYTNDDVTIFDDEIDKIQDKINKIIDDINIHPIVKSFRVEYQHDPRGNTVKLFYNDNFIDLN